MNCKYCNNSSVDPSLTPDNDLSYCSIGVCDKGTNMFIRTGNTKRTSIVVHRWDKKTDKNIIVGIYDMKYCPECGRKLTENNLVVKNI